MNMWMLTSRQVQAKKRNFSQRTIKNKVFEREAKHLEVKHLIEEKQKTDTSRKNYSHLKVKLNKW